MRGEDFIKIILVIIGVIVWLISSALKANKKAKENLLNLKKGKFPNKSDDISGFLDTNNNLAKQQFKHETAEKKTYTYAGETYVVENSNNSSIKNELKKESLISKGDKTEIEKRTLEKDQLEKNALRKKYLKKQELIEHDYNYQGLTSSKNVNDEEENDIKIELDFSADNILKGFIFKEIIERRGRNR